MSVLMAMTNEEFEAFLIRARERFKQFMKRQARLAYLGLPPDWDSK